MGTSGVEKRKESEFMRIRPRRGRDWDAYVDAGLCALISSRFRRQRAFGDAMRAVFRPPAPIATSYIIGILSPRLAADAFG